MPFQTIKAAKEGRFPTVINDIPLTIGQVNTLAKIHDAIKERGGVDEPMAVAISTFKKAHKVVDGKFVTKQDMSEEYIGDCITIELEEQKKMFSIEKEIFMIGTHVDARGNKRTFKEEDLDKIISAFEQGVRSRNGVPLKLGHSKEQPLLNKAELPNAGIVSKLRKQGGKIIALIENVPKLIKEFIENKHFKTVSSGLLANYTDTVLNKKFDLVLDHIALLGQTAPAIKGLDEFKQFFVENAYMFSEANGKMINIELQEKKTENGVEFPKEAYAYVPDPDKPSTWKLRIWQDLENKVTRSQLGKAAAAFSPGGFRGQKVQIPSEDVAKVKSKLRSEYNKLGVKREEIPRQLFMEKEIKMEEKIKELEAKNAELSEQTKALEKEKAEFAEKMEKIEADNKAKELKVKEVDVKNFLESDEVTKIILPYQRVDYTEVLMKADDLEAKKAEILKYEEKIDLDEKGQAKKKDDIMDSDIKAEKEKMEDGLQFSSGEKIEIVNFDLHKKAQKAVKDKEFETYEEAIIAFSPVK
jgi:hypothetical protein